MNATVLLNPDGERLRRHNGLMFGKRRGHRVERYTGSLSLKTVLRGYAVWSTRRGAYRVDPGHWLILEAGTTYSLQTAPDVPVETFCPFFAPGFAEEAWTSASTADERQLDDPGYLAPSPFVERLRPVSASAELRDLLIRMRDGLQAGWADGPWLEERFRDLALALPASEAQLRATMARLPAARASTRAELFSRLSRARDYMHAHAAAPLDVPALARVAGLSPFHFHRRFRACFGETPHAYLTRLRVERARVLLRETELPVIEICLEVGFESLGSFSALFRRECGLPPGAWRKAQDRRSAPPAAEARSGHGS